MVVIERVQTKKQRRAFLQFPLKLFEDNPYFVPPLYMEEKKIFTRDFTYGDICEVAHFLAYRDEKVVGRISGIIQTVSNELRNEKRVRFDRFDAVNDIEVAKALFAAVEAWGKEQGMDTIVGPLGFSDLEREGLLVEGFDQLSTFEEQYHADYYQDLITACGFVKEVDWTESRLYLREDADDSMKKMADYVLNRYHLHLAKTKSVREIVNKYEDQFFELLDKSYAQLYGTVPFTDRMKKMMLDNFKLIVRKDQVAIVLDENEKMVCLGICFPSIASAVQKSKGHLTPACLWRILKAKHHPKVIDLGLVGVDPAYLNRGISSVVVAALEDMLRADGIEYAETNLNLEDNAAIQNMWKRFKRVDHKRRRAYVKEIGG